MLEGRRPRSAGSNARLGPHGDRVRPPFARLTLADGTTGFGLCRLTEEQAAALLGAPLEDLFLLAEGGATERGRPVEFALWDLMGRRAGKPVSALAAEIAGAAAPEESPRPVRCYDTSLYFDDLHLADDSAAADLLASEAREGYERGHRGFKIKVGRGARHLPPDAGTRRDIAVVRAVREAVGPEAALLLDANNGYTLNLTKRVLDETADCGIFWIEEAFHEDDILYQDLKEWLRDRGLPVRIADGEGLASPALMEWARRGLVDVLQYDILHPGFTRWLALGQEIAAWGTGAAPHHYGAFYGNYVTGHLNAALPNLLFVEWDEATVPGVDTSGYRVREGYVHLPNTPGFGLELDEETFRRAVAESGFTICR